MAQKIFYLLVVLSVGVFSLVGCPDLGAEDPCTGFTCGNNEECRLQGDSAYCDCKIMHYRCEGACVKAGTPCTQTQVLDAGAPPDEEITGRYPDGGVDCSTPVDWDEDGFVDHRCGGDDCNDENDKIHPDAQERCDTIDNNCNNENNEGIDCWFYAHSPRTLYKVDPFAFTIEDLGDLPTTFYDFDTAPEPNNKLYGVTSGGKIMWLDEEDNSWNYVDATQTSVGGNGFAIDMHGIGYITKSDKLYEVDLTTGSTSQSWNLEASPNQELQIYSSGDCVINKDNSFYMTSRIGSTDELVFVDPVTREGVLVGDTGYNAIYGLTAAWRNLYGLTSEGELLLLDPNTGAGELLYDFGDISFYGAASSPSR